MSTLALIPARGGSKGIPRKNLLSVAGKPLIVWTIEQALAVPAGNANVRFSGLAGAVDHAPHHSHFNGFVHIPQLLLHLFCKTHQVNAGAPAGGADLAKVLQNSIDQVNQTQQQAEGMAANFAAGDGNANLHEVMISLQKANVSFQEMVQVRNKLVTAYHDVMNMQV